MTMAARARIETRAEFEASMELLRDTGEDVDMTRYHVRKFRAMDADLRANIREWQRQVKPLIRRLRAAQAALTPRTQGETK
jgi:hypothetical protein